MQKFKIQAYNNSDYGPIEEMFIKVPALTEAEAIEKAKKVVVRENYAVIEIEVLDGEVRQTNRLEKTNHPQQNTRA